MNQAQIYQPIYSTNKRYILITGGRGSGKSFAINTFLCQLSYEQNQYILFTRYTMTSAEISIIPEFKDKIDRLDVSSSFKINKADITNKCSGSPIVFRGIKTSSGNQTANLKSISGLSTFVVDEAEEFVNEEDFDTIDYSVRTSSVQNRVIIILNPTSKNHWIYKKWIQNTHKIVNYDGLPVEISTHPDVLHIHTTFIDNISNLNESFIKQALSLRKERPKYYGFKFIGQWQDSVEGSLFEKGKFKTFKYSEEIEKAFESSVAYIDVADEGSDYVAMFVGRNIGTSIYITDIVFTDKNIDVSIPLCVASIKKNKVSYCRVESNNMGSIFAKNIQNELDSCQVLTVSNHSNKHTRILMDAPFIMEFFVVLNEMERSAMYEDALNQMGNYTKILTKESKPHDDAADAASGLKRFIEGLFSHLY